MPDCLNCLYIFKSHIYSVAGRVFYLIIRQLIPVFAAGIRLLVSENEQLINQRSMEGHWNTEYFKLTFLILNLNRKPLYNEGWEKFK